MTYQGGAVAILGAGPAALLAAHAVELSGRIPVVFAAPDELGHVRKSVIAGATYLHSSITDLTSAAPDDEIYFRKLGTKSGYALKVYGSTFAPCSWDSFPEGARPAWHLQPVYNELWARFWRTALPTQIGPLEIRDIIDSFPVVISTIPASAICCEDHDFPKRDIWISNESTPEVRDAIEDNVVIYDGQVGTPHDRYRSAKIFGEHSTEYMQEVEGAVRGMKVLPTNCDCHPEVLRVGRWGEWKPGILVNNAFEKVAQRFSIEGNL